MLKTLLFMLIMAMPFLVLSCKDHATSPDEDNNTLTDYDGNVYKIIKIGDQKWMAENLKVTHYRNGESIPNVTDSMKWSNLNTGAYCSYNNDNDNINIYGLLYNWYAVNDSRMIAPEGWHVPTNEDFITLENYLISNSYNWDGTTEGNKIAKALAAKTGWNSSSEEGDIGNDTTSNNSRGFSALPGGYRSCGNGMFISAGNYGRWWSATEHEITNSLMFGLNYDSPAAGINYHDKHYGFSIRLIKN